MTEIFTIQSQALPPEGTQVLGFQGTERLSTPYRFNIGVAIDHPIDLAKAVRARATLAIHGDGAFGKGAPPYQVHGVVAQIQRLRQHGSRSLYRLLLVPQLWTLSQGRRTRVFVDLTVPAILEQVLRANGFSGEDYAFKLLADYKSHAFVCQYKESDYAFLARWMEREGIYFFFEQSGEREKLVITDSKTFHEASPSMPVLFKPFVEGDAMSGEALNDFSGRHIIQPKGVELLDFNPLQPALDVRADTDVDTGAGAVVHMYGGHVATAADAQRLAKIRGEELDARAVIYSARGRVFQLRPGYTFVLSQHPEVGNNREYLCSELRHSGNLVHGDAQLRRELGINSAEEYRVQVECVPSDTQFRSSQALPWPRVDGSETAIVTGPPGQEIHTDQHGRIMVRFHWDADTPVGTETSCWIRVSQGWAGAQWGHQFVPRVGHEVVVSFLGGDPDRPLVTGCVYNGHNPTPFNLPEHRTRSGFRTQTTPRNDEKVGFNELSFEDAAGQEQIYVRAERDLVEFVQQDHRTTVEEQQHLLVKGDQYETVEKNRTRRVIADESRHIGRDFRSVVDGNREDTVFGSLTTTVASTARHNYQENRSTHVDGRERYKAGDEVDVELESHGLLRVGGCLTTIVGSPDAERSSTLFVQGASHAYSTDMTVLESEKGIVLQCGDSSIRMTPKSIELSSPTVFVRGDEANVAAATVRINASDLLSSRSSAVLLSGSGASLGLADGAAKLCGGSVQLGTSPEAAAGLPDAEAVKRTNVALTDHDGNAVGHARFLVEFEDGAQLSGVTDAEGKASLEIDRAATVVFPDFDIKPS